jgi:hypothetical protein
VTNTVSFPSFFTVYRIFLCTLTLCNTSFLTRSIQLIFPVLLQHHIPELSRLLLVYFPKCPNFSTPQLRIKYSTLLAGKIKKEMVCGFNRQPGFSAMTHFHGSRQFLPETHAGYNSRNLSVRKQQSSWYK